MDKCINCKQTAGMASFHAVGLWDGDTYLGGVCPNCIFYPERQSARVQELLAKYA